VAIQYTYLDGDGDGDGVGDGVGAQAEKTLFHSIPKIPVPKRYSFDSVF